MNKIRENCRTIEKIKEMAIKITARISMGIMLTMVAVTPCFADITNVGQNAGGWIQEQAFYIALAVVAVVLAGFVLKKAWIPAIIFIILASIILAVIAAPDTLKTFGQALLTRFTR